MPPSPPLQKPSLFFNKRHASLATLPPTHLPNNTSPRLSFTTHTIHSITNGILFGIAMSLAFHLTTGDTAIARACALLAGKHPSTAAAAAAGGGGKVEGEGDGGGMAGQTPASHAHGATLRSPFLDSRLMERCVIAGEYMWLGCVRLVRMMVGCLR